MNKEVDITVTIGEPTNASAARDTTPALVVRRPQWRRSVVKSEGVRVTQVKPSN